MPIFKQWVVLFLAVSFLLELSGEVKINAKQVRQISSTILMIIIYKETWNKIETVLRKTKFKLSF